MMAARANCKGFIKFGRLPARCAAREAKLFVFEKLPKNAAT